MTECYLRGHTMRENSIMKALVLGAAALALSVANASADGYRHGYRYHYGYATPVFEYSGNAYYGFSAPSYIHTSWPIYAAVPVRAAPVVSAPSYGYGSGYWGGYGYGWR
jgi:hypothetical protein